MSETREIVVLVDADACPVKEEIYAIAHRRRVRVVVVANAPIAVPRDPLIERIVVPAGLDVADDRIAEEAGPGRIVVTADVPLAGRAVKAGAVAIAPNGSVFDEASIGMAVAMRDLMTDLRSAGATTSGPKPFAPRDRSRFRSALDLAIVRLERAGFGTSAGGARPPG
ncbi:YaiI/YqxD family protein [Salinarimonas sp.]|uniref:YaiI/YqxD family protein n=1 Tax=Salinarimonas sp. TaxID=2766526 RepID=UPI0039189B20